MPAIYSRPSITGSSNTRQTTREGKIRRSGKNYHENGHWDCDASDFAKGFLTASAPGLSMENWHYKTILGGDADGLSIPLFWQSLMNDPIFNGHMVLWLLDNDIDFLLGYRYENMNLAAKEYLTRISQFIRGLKFTRLYLITMPMRQHDFKANSHGMSNFLFKAKFNQELRKIFAEDNVLINGIPTSLIDLNSVWPEYTFQDDKHFCEKEIKRKYLPTNDQYYDPFPGIHYNKECYKEFLKYIVHLLRLHDGLPKRLTLGSNPTMFNEIQPWQCGTLTGLDIHLKTDMTKPDIDATPTLTPTNVTEETIHTGSTNDDMDKPDNNTSARRPRWNHSKLHVTCTFDLFRLFRRIQID